MRSRCGVKECIAAVPTNLSAGGVPSVDYQELSRDSTWQAVAPVPRSSKGVFAPLSPQSCVAHGLSSEQDFLAPGHANGSLHLEHMHVLTGKGSCSFFCCEVLSMEGE